MKLLERELGEVTAKLAVDEVEKEMNLPDAPKTQNEIGDKDPRDKRIEKLKSMQEVLITALVRLKE